MALGVRHFVYSSAIPVIGADLVEKVSAKHAITMISSNMAAKQSGVFVNGTLKTDRFTNSSEGLAFVALP